MCYYNRLLVECTELVIGKSSMFQITNVITASRQQLILSSLTRQGHDWAEFKFAAVRCSGVFSLGHKTRSIINRDSMHDMAAFSYVVEIYHQTAGLK